MEFISNFTDMLSQPVVKLGTSALTWWSLIYMSVLMGALMVLTGRTQRFILRQAQDRTKVDVGIIHGISTIVRYVFVGIGFLVILQSAGVDLSSLTILAGAIGLGLTVGLQNLTSNVMSGLTLFLERPVKVGDRVQVDNVTGDITKITFRATTILTDDNIEIIVPNTQFITGKVINWSLSSPNVRLSLPLSLAIDSEPKRIKLLVERLAVDHPGVLKQPEPELIFLGFAESSLKFELWVWTCEYTRRPFVLKSQLYFQIFEKFKEENIAIPFPQTDIHIRTGAFAQIDAEDI